jgi:hypothetical protein
MRRIVLTAVLAWVAGFAVPVATATDARAFGDTCHRDVSARGGVQASMKAARSSAIAAWESAVSRKHGSRFANWYYAGNRIKCTAVAGPCGRKR